MMLCAVLKLPAHLPKSCPLVSLWNIGGEPLFFVFLSFVQRKTKRVLNQQLSNRVKPFNPICWSGMTDVVNIITSAKGSNVISGICLNRQTNLI